MTTTISPSPCPRPCPASTPRAAPVVRSPGPASARGRLALAAGALLVLAGCGGAGSTQPADPTTAATVADATSPTVVDDTATPVASPTPGPTGPASAPDASEDVTGDLTGDVGTATPPPLHPSVDDFPAGRVVVEPGGGAEPIPVAVRIADTPQRRGHGLMEVEEVPDGAGMWFAYDADSTGRYYMLGTRTDLDIAWVDAEGTVVATETMRVCPEEPCERYDPQAAYRNALEVSAGWLAANGVEVGDRITLDASAS